MQYVLQAENAEQASMKAARPQQNTQRLSSGGSRTHCDKTKYVTALHRGDLFEKFSENAAQQTWLTLGRCPLAMGPCSQGLLL